MIGGDAGPTVSPEPVLIGSSSRSIRIKTSASAETAGGQGRLPGNQTAVNKRRLAQPPCILESVRYEHAYQPPQFEIN